MGWCIYIGRDTGRDEKKVKWTSEKGQVNEKKQTGNQIYLNGLIIIRSLQIQIHMFNPAYIPTLTIVNGLHLDQIQFGSSAIVLGLLMGGALVLQTSFYALHLSTVWSQHCHILSLQLANIH